VAGLEDPGVHDLAHGLTGDLLDGVPQVGGLGVGVLVGVQVVADARLEAILAQVLLEHPDDRGALLVGEHVEHALGVGGGDHLVLDGAGGGERVGVERHRAGQPKSTQRSQSGGRRRWSASP
jgi:hypothetical protein